MIVWTHYPDGDERRPGTQLFVGREIPQSDHLRGIRLLLAWNGCVACSIGFWIGFWIGLAYWISRINALVAAVTR